MKHSRMKLAALLATSALGGAALTLPWHTLEAGGGTSTGTTAGGTVLTLRGTIGQFDATASAPAGGGLELAGGFWAAVVPAPGGPQLVIEKLSATTAAVRWGADATGWQLQTSVDLVTWTDLGSVISSAGQLTVDPQPGVPRRFYRLTPP